MRGSAPTLATSALRIEVCGAGHQLLKIGFHAVQHWRKVTMKRPAGERVFNKESKTICLIIQV